MKEKVIIVTEDGYYKVRVVGLPILKQTILEVMKKLPPPLRQLGLKDMWILPVKTPQPVEIPPAVVRPEVLPKQIEVPMEVPPAVVKPEVTPKQIEGKTEVPDLAKAGSTLKLVANKIVIPVIPPEPKISLQVGSFFKRSEALRAQRRISVKFKREVVLVQQFEYYFIIIPGFYTRRETFPYYPELAGMGYNKVSVIERK
jgi:hypothetical protein